MSGGGGSSSTSVQQYSPEEAARRTQVMDEAQRIYGATAPMMTQQEYPGAQPISFSPQTQQARRMGEQYAGQAQQMFGDLAKAQQFGLGDVLYAESNPYLQSSIDAAIRPITQSYMDPNGVMSQIRTGAQEAGQFGGSRQGIAEGIAAGRYAQQVGDTAAKMASEGYGQGLETFGRTMALAPQNMQAGMMPMNIYSGLGQQLEMLAADQEAYNAAAREWQLNAPWMPLENYASIVYGGASPGSSTTSPGMSTGQRLANAGMAGLGTYGMIAGATSGAAAGSMGASLAAANPYIAAAMAAATLFS